MTHRGAGWCIPTSLLPFLTFASLSAFLCIRIQIVTTSTKTERARNRYLLCNMHVLGRNLLPSLTHSPEPACICWIQDYHSGATLGQETQRSEQGESVLIALSVQQSVSHTGRWVYFRQLSHRTCLSTACEKHLTSLIPSLSQSHLWARPVLLTPFFWTLLWWSPWQSHWHKINMSLHNNAWWKLL